MEIRPTRRWREFPHHDGAGSVSRRSATPRAAGPSDLDPGSAEGAQREIYRRLRAIAGQRMRTEHAGHTLQATAVVHEVWLRLMDLAPERMRDPAANRPWILAMGATLTRHVLVDHARRRMTLKRGGGRSGIRLTSAHGADAGGLDVLLLDDLLDTLAAEKPLEAQVVALRVFGGLSHDEIAQATGETDYRIRTAWAIARAWIGRHLVEGRARPGAADFGSDPGGR